jgi:glucuronosyltransferase
MYAFRLVAVPESLFEIRGAFKYILSHWEMGISITDKLLEDAAVQNLIHSEDKIFDVIITEAFFNEAFLGFAHKFKAPVIQISTIDGASWVGDWFGNSAPYSYVPNNYLSYGDHMDFSQRIMNTIVGSFFRLGRHFYYLQKQDYIMKKHFCTLHQLPPLYELEKNTRLILLNHHFSLSSPKPLMPNMVPIAGMIIKTPKALPQVISLSKYRNNCMEQSLS